MSPQAEAFADWISKAETGDEAATRVVRAVCERAVKVAPNRDLLMIARAIVGMSDDFSPALLVERN